MGKAMSLLLITATVALAQPVAHLEMLRGKKVPDFRLRDLSGREHRFRQFQGKVVLLNFWSPG